MSDSGLEPERERAVALGADLIIPALGAAFTIYFLVDAADLVWEARATGTVVGITLLTLIAIQVVRVLVQWWSGAATLGLGELASTDPAQVKRVALLILASLFVATITWFGTTLGIFLMMTASMWVLGVRRVPTLLMIAGATAAAVYLLFIAFLQTRLPQGIIEMLVARVVGGG